MNDTYGTTAYFDSQSDARRAADDMRAQGMKVDLRSRDSHGESFWDSIKNFFTGHKDSGTDYDRYGSGAVLIVEQGDPTLVETIVVQYNGTLSGSSGYGTGMTGGYPGRSTSTIDETDYGSTATSAGIAGAAGANAGSTTGDVDYAGGMREDMERAGSRRSTSARNRDLADADLTDDDNTL